MFLLIIGAIFISSLLSLIGAFILSRKSTWKESFSLELTAFAAGVMLTTALLHLAPEALHSGLSEERVFQVILSAIVIFFLMERMVWWFHHHHDHHDVKPSALLITVGDSIHNFVDGVAIAAAFLIDPTIGLVTTIAVGLHEIPQEIADFVVMVRAGVSRKRALLVNVVSSTTAILGGTLTFLFDEPIEGVLPLVLAFSAGMFMYIALSDLIPELHSTGDATAQRWKQTVWLFFGILLTFVVTSISEEYLHQEDHDELEDADYHIERQVELESDL